MHYSATRQVLLTCALIVGLLLSTGCDSDGSAVEDANVSGTYTFTTLAFEPDATALPTANILSTLAANQATVQFFANGRFALEYRMAGSTQDLVMEGTYDVDGNRVDIHISDSFDDEREDLLIPQDFTLRTVNDGATLETDIDTRVNLSGFSDEYSGLGGVDGTYLITLTR